MEQNERTPDIFDKIMRLPLLRIGKPFFDDHREGLLYLFFGACTTLVNLGLSALFWYVFHWESIYWDSPFGRVAIGTFAGNLISIVVSILFAYVTNRHWVFQSKVRGAKAVSVELAKFFAGRLVTLIIEIGGVQLTVIWFPDDSVILFIGKLITQVIVIALNFIFSKVFVFKSDKEDQKFDI